MSEQLAVIHAGPAATDLKRQLATLDSVGVRETNFMDDLVSTLRFEDHYLEDMNNFLGEVMFSEFYHWQLSRGHREEFKDYTQRFMEDTARVSKHVLRHLHETLTSRSLYDKTGKFPYEFHSFDGRLIYLKRP